MSCANPIPAVDLGFKVNKNGERVRNIKLLDMRFKNINFGLEELKEKYGDSLVLLPCGHCYLCAENYAKEWSTRIMLESQHHDCSSFITLTYSDVYCPDKLSKRDIQLFMKRFRKAVDVPIRYFLCGEYGDHTERPHYHAIIFGFDFPDKELLQKSKSGYMIYRSSLLEKLWPFGISSIGELTSESAQYVAKYSLKRKMTGQDKGEFVLMSRRPGIGALSYTKDFWFTDHIYLNGKTVKVPRYFNKLAEKYSHFEQVLAKQERIDRGKTYKSEKFAYSLEREEEALKRKNDFAIFNSCLKVRF